MGYEKGKIKADYYLKNVIEDNTSKNLKYWLEDAIANDHINYFEFSSFTNNDYIAEGGFGKVYKYLWKNCRLTVALKCLKVKNDFDEKDVKDFVREHSKNILIDQNQPKIADFGLSKQIDRKSITNSDSSINGMMPYIEPKCFSDYDPKYKRNKKSDVYSFGVILWEISSGRPPFQYFTNEMVIVQVFQGKREEPIEGTPSKYVELYKKCWDMEPVNRPETKLIFEFLNQIKPIKYGHTSLSSNRDYIEV
ncbi:kinase-like domain-containing protein [Gigaspora margarita]|uniref:Kinase-like domain-containing protein n=1 Tax=Gigaspora margarita TaxID=4874 RepID=A0A8H3X8C6_GIGMA|nr:kinase-like domain-containing protein [Gigaspora margarita]